MADVGVGVGVHLDEAEAAAAVGLAVDEDLRRDGPIPILLEGISWRSSEVTAVG